MTDIEQANPSIDLSTFEGLASSFDEGRTISILHPKTDKPTGLTVRVASYQSERVKTRHRKIANASMLFQKRNPRKIISAEKNEKNAIELVMAATISWGGFELDGKVLECTDDNLRMVLENPDLWFIRDQIDAAADDLATFIRA